MSIAAGHSRVPTDRLEHADQLEAAGRLRDAARTLEGIARDQRTAEIDARIVRLRHRAFRELTGGTASATAPHASAADQDAETEPPDLFAGRLDAPEVTSDELTLDALRSAVHHHGCLIVRGLLSPARCDELRSDIDAAFDGYDRKQHYTDTPASFAGYSRLEIDEGFEAPDPLGTAFLRKGGGVYAPDAPSACVDYLQALTEAGVIDVVSGYLGAMPVLSSNKFVLRRIGGGAEPSWHQDGIYLGVDRQAVNLWVSLSECGGDTDTMGLDILPCNRHELAEMGTHDAVDERAVSQHVAQVVARETGRPIQRPHFLPGDGIFFDQFFLHRSDVRPLPRERYAVESWFFTAEDFPEHLIPVVAG